MSKNDSKLDAYVLYAGVSSLPLADEAVVDFGDGVFLRKCYARFGTPFHLVNTDIDKHPKGILGDWEAGMPVSEMPPAMWQLYTRNLDVVAELAIPPNVEADFDARLKLARVIVFALRLYADPAVTFHVASTQAFDTLIQRRLEDTALLPLETSVKHFALHRASDDKLTAGIQWVAKHWKTINRLYKSSTEFRFAADALDMAQFVQNNALTLVSLWAAIEALFSPSTTELKFRVSALVAAYLYPPSTKRLETQKKIAALYDKRSAAAHGKPKHESEHLLETFEILRRALIKIVEKGEVPTKDQLDLYLFTMESFGGKL